LPQESAIVARPVIVIILIIVFIFNNLTPYFNITLQI